MGSTTTKGERTRQAILTAAIERFGRDGYRATSVTDIARAAEVSGTLVYAYFADKEDLFIAALDHDAAGIIDEALSTLLATPGDDSWRTTVLSSLVASVERHPLARRMLAGLEPATSDRILDLPALASLRTAVADRLRADQAAGAARADIDPATVGSGLVSIFLALLTSSVHFGPAAVGGRAADVIAVLEAAILPPATDHRR